MNSLNLRQVCGGDTIKQADFGSELAFELLDEQYVKFREPLGESAKVILKKDNTAIYQKSVPIAKNTVSFKFDKILPVGSYVLEIIVGDYVFPSNNRVIITVEQTYGDFEPEYLVKVSYEELKADVDDVKTKIEQFENTLNANETNVNQELLAINQNASDMNKRIESLENREDKDTIYNDTEIKQSVADVDTKVDNLSEKVTTLEERPIVDTALTERVEALERKEDKDTVYDDSNLKSQIVELQEKLKSLNTVRRAPTGYTLDRTTTPWTIWFDNGCGLQMPDYSPRKEQEQASTIYGYGYSLNLMTTTVGTYPVPQNFIAASMGHISLNNFSKQDANAFIYFSPSMKVINPVRNDAEKIDWSHCYGEANEDNSVYKRKHVFPRVCYELGIWSEADVLYLGATKK
ncbi:hypothetical protein [Enterococcus cecorum]|uniref:hypothetical protein n=1 Tax=Enterococcus cecorum TaxID=44008 RepID=UPI003266B755